MFGSSTSVGTSVYRGSKIILSVLYSELDGDTNCTHPHKFHFHPYPSPQRFVRVHTGLRKFFPALGLFHPRWFKCRFRFNKWVSLMRNQVLTFRCLEQYLKELLVRSYMALEVSDSSTVVNCVISSGILRTCFPSPR